MALIICPECGHQVSDKADKCPNCGYPLHSSTLTQQNQETEATMHQPISQSANSQTPPPVPASGNKKKSKAPWIVGFALAAAICGVGYFYYNDAQQQKELDDYEFAMRSDDPMMLEAYLLRNQNAPEAHRDSVNARLQMLRQNDNDWNNAIVSGSKNALQEYINTHPDSPHKGQALNKIDSIDFAIAEREYKSSGNKNLEPYKIYLANHPDGRYAATVQDVIDQTKATTVTPEELAQVKNVCKRFFQAINSKNEVKLLETVTSTLTSFLNRTGAANTDVITFMNKLYKDDITNMNWHILDDFKAEKVKNEDGTSNIAVTFGAEQKIDRTDASKENFGRYTISAEITPDGHITKFNMKKTTTGE